MLNKAVSHTVKIGNLNFEGWVLDNNEEAFELSAAATYLSVKKDTIIDIVPDTPIEYNKIQINGKNVNYITVEELALFCYRWACSGRDLKGRAYEIAYSYFSSKEDKDENKISILRGVKALHKSNHKYLSKHTDKQREAVIKAKYSVLWDCEEDYIVEYDLKGFKSKIGCADLVNDKIIVQVKNCREWKSAMGELLAYQEALQRTEIWLILFKSKIQETIAIKKVLNNLGIGVKFIKN